MCATCGCQEVDVRITTVPPHAHGNHDPAHEHPHPAGHMHPHQHEHEHHKTRTIPLEVDVLAKNDGLAARNREWLAARSAVAVNLMSSPGSGKTTLLERTIRLLSPTVPVFVVEGDQETLLDAARIRATGVPVVQINTGSGCHLDADMLIRGLTELAPGQGALVLVENVGNLVCPALFDLGEARRVVVSAVTEGADKPLKYPQMFASADLVVVNKTDLLPYVDVDLAELIAAVHSVNPRADVLPVSATRGDGMSAWLDWLAALRPSAALRP